jgi:hypothetical protein
VLVFRWFVDTAGAESDDLCSGGIADFGVSGLVTDLRSVADLAEEEPTLEVWPLARQIKAPSVPSNKKILHFIIECLESAVPSCTASSIRAQFSS